LGMVSEAYAVLKPDRLRVDLDFDASPAGSG
jgi:hypothetical protein